MKRKDGKQRAGVVAKHEAFLAAYRVTASITLAAKAVGVDRSLHYQWIRDTAGYLEEFELAQDEAGQLLEDEAVRRATEGVFEPLSYQGQFSYAADAYVLDKAASAETGKKVYKLKPGARPLGVFKQSDALLQFLLKGFRPEKYRDSWKGEISGPNGGPIPVEVEQLRKLTDDELAALSAIAEKFTAAPLD